ncbi:MAG TPA: ABC transporter permease [Gemmatimonadales bacterium]|nr:ABC transporter permease [Gemmatimonadales bacterium]
MMDAVAVAGDVLVAAVGIAAPLALAATGETIAERSGVVNLGVEGAMLFGALGGAIGATVAGPAAGLGVGILAGVLVAALFAAVAIGAGADQIITGTAVTLASVGLTGTIYRQFYGPAGVGLSLPTLPPVPVPWLSDIPLVGRAFFGQPVTSYLAIGLLPLTWCWLFRTRFGLAIRAAGEEPTAARAAGVPVRRTRAVAVLAGGAFAGLAGATLVLAQVGTFTERMTAGRGFIAIAIVVLGRWNPVGAGLAALLFGLATAVQFALQAAGLDVPYQVFLMFPYLLTLLALAGAVGRVKAPGALGKNED